MTLLMYHMHVSGHQCHRDIFLQDRLHLLSVKLVRKRGKYNREGKQEGCCQSYFIRYSEHLLIPPVMKALFKT